MSVQWTNFFYYGDKLTDKNTSENIRREDILSGSLYKLIVKLSLPIMLSNLVQTVYSLTDMYFVSTIGDGQVAAVGFVWPMIFLYMAPWIGCSFGLKGDYITKNWRGRHARGN